MARKKQGGKGRGWRGARKEVQRRAEAPRFTTEGQLASFYWGVVLGPWAWENRALYLTTLQVRMKAGGPVYCWDDDGTQFRSKETLKLWTVSEGQPWKQGCLMNRRVVDGQGPVGWHFETEEVQWPEPHMDWTFKGRSFYLSQLPTQRVVVRAQVVRGKVKLTLEVLSVKRPPAPGHCELVSHQIALAGLTVEEGGRVRLHLNTTNDLTFQLTAAHLAKMEEDDRCSEDEYNYLEDEYDNLEERARLEDLWAAAALMR